MNKVGQSWPQVNRGVYRWGSYSSMERWSSYWHQIDEALKGNFNKILVIGIGDSIVVNLLKMYGKSVKTFDIDRSLNPDYLGSVTDLNQIVKEEKFDTVLCCQVLEHLPFNEFENILSQIQKVTLYKAIISLPYRYIKFEIFISLPKLGFRKIRILLPKFFKKWSFNGEHYWEIGTKGYSKFKIIHAIQKYFTIESNYHVLFNPYHLFFVLKPRGKEIE